ncbi:MAG: hypothetical protein KUG82_12775 [Pseudomonadales bacterium]|nr:hypothetical protein [Pseudomonadales bacterium]
MRVIESGVYANTQRDYQLIEVSNAENQSVFVQWLPPASAELNKTVVFSSPYEGVDWTGLEVDTRWASENGLPGCYEDVDSPGYVEGLGSTTCYSGTVSPQVAADRNIGFLLNNLGVLIVYGRFYPGETL